MSRKSWTLAMAVVVGLGAWEVGAREARAQVLGRAVVVEPAPVYEAVAPMRYTVKYRPRGVVVRERVGRPYLAPVAVAAPVVAETSMVQPAPIVARRVIQPAPVVQTRVLQPPPVVERRVIQPAPIVETDVLQPDPVIQTRYFAPY